MPGEVPIDPSDALAEVPPPVLLNTWKHHAGALRQRIAHAAEGGQTGLDELARGLIVTGTDLMDMYLGGLTPRQIAAGVLAELQTMGRLEREAFRQWVQASGGYLVVTLPEDQSRWVLRWGEEPGRYVHVHPARWAPHTVRVRANVLRTAVMAVAHAAAAGGDPRDVGLINHVRTHYLGYAPLALRSGGEGIRSLIDHLRPPP